MGRGKTRSFLTRLPKPITHLRLRMMGFAITREERVIALSKTTQSYAEKPQGFVALQMYQDPNMNSFMSQVPANCLRSSHG